MDRLNLKVTLKKDEIRSLKDCSDVEYSIEVEALVTTLVQKLNLNTIKHEKLYRF